MNLDLMTNKEKVGLILKTGGLVIQRMMPDAEEKTWKQIAKAFNRHRRRIRAWQSIIAKLQRRVDSNQYLDVHQRGAIIRLRDECKKYGVHSLDEVYPVTAKGVNGRQLIQRQKDAISIDGDDIVESWLLKLVEREFFCIVAEDN